MSAPVLQSEAQLGSSGGSVAPAAAAARDPAERPARAAASSARTPQPGPGSGRSPAPGPGQAEVLSRSRGPHLASFPPSPSRGSSPAAEGRSSRRSARRKRPASGGQFGPPNPKCPRRGAAPGHTAHGAHSPPPLSLPPSESSRPPPAPPPGSRGAAGRPSSPGEPAVPPPLRAERCFGEPRPCGKCRRCPRAPPGSTSGGGGEELPCPAPQRCPSAAPAGCLRRQPSRSPPGEVPSRPENRAVAVTDWKRSPAPRCAAAVQPTPPRPSGRAPRSAQACRSPAGRPDGTARLLPLPHGLPLPLRLATAPRGGRPGRPPPAPAPCGRRRLSLGPASGR